MNATEFQTVIHNGVIALPENQQSWNGKKIRVILLEEAETSSYESTGNDDFFSGAGLWENREIDQESIRAKAWRDDER